MCGLGELIVGAPTITGYIYFYSRIMLYANFMLLLVISTYIYKPIPTETYMGNLHWHAHVYMYMYTCA